jgi:hypothetical protein
VFLAQVVDVGPGGLEDPRPRAPPSIATKAKSFGLTDACAADSRASNWRCDNPSVGDSDGTLGRRTCSAGEYSRIPSITQVR